MSPDPLDTKRGIGLVRKRYRATTNVSADHRVYPHVRCSGGSFMLSATSASNSGLTCLASPLSSCSALTSTLAAARSFPAVAREAFGDRRSSVR
jgi:hypothetical protein